MTGRHPSPAFPGSKCNGPCVSCPLCLLIGHLSKNNTKTHSFKGNAPKPDAFTQKQHILGWLLGKYVLHFPTCKWGPFAPVVLNDTQGTGDMSKTQENQNLGQIVSNHVVQAAKHIGLSSEIAAILAHPQRILSFNFPVRMDSGEYRLFQGYRVQHNNILGPYKGGIRYHQDVTMEEVIGLASAMTWKSGLHDLPYGGGKGGITFDPSKHTKSELERITRAFAQALGPYIGPDLDIPAPDVGTNGQTMAWLVDTYMNSVPIHQRNTALGVVTGKPIAVGGSQGRESATGHGVAYCIAEWAKQEGISLQGKKMAIQGFGNVGSFAGKMLGKMGLSLVAVGDHGGYITQPAGINPDDLAEYVKKTGSVAGFAGTTPISRDDFFAVSCDFMIPAALEMQITEKEARNIKAICIAEGANGPTLPQADAILQQRNIAVLPDILVNSGGVMVSYFEWLQNRQCEYWSAEEIEARLEKRMKRVFAAVHERTKKEKISHRLASYAKALERLQSAYALRGIAT